jgi:transposase
MSASPLFVGIDVAKAELVISLGPSSDLLTVSNDESGIRHVLEHLQTACPALIVLEATGGYETAAVAALAAAGLPVVVANPRQVRAFAKAMGKLAKTDNIDAHVLALFAERVRPPIRPLPDEALRTLDAL